MTLVTLRLQGNQAAWCQEIVELESSQSSSHKQWLRALERA
jgi:hypothetical protein